MTIQTPPPPSNACLWPRRKARAAALAVALLAASLTVSSAGPAAAQDSGEVVLVSNRNQATSPSPGILQVGSSNPDSFDVSFTTGSSTHGYLLTKVTTRASTFGRQFEIYLHADSSGSIGSSLHRLIRTSAGQLVAQDHSADGFEVRVEPNTKYWLRFTAPVLVDFAATDSDSVDSSSAAGWSINSPSGIKPKFSLSGKDAPQDRYNDTAGSDFAADSSTLGRLELGTLSSGTLSDRADRDLFKLEDLPATSNSARDGQANRWDRKRYRVQAWFGDHAPGDVRGGEIFIMEGSPSGSGSLYSSVSDTSEDGLSLFEFEAFPNIDYYVMVVPTAPTQVFKTRVVSGVVEESYELENRTYTGAYKLKIDDVSHIEEMADTLHETAPTGVPRVRVTHGTTDSTKDVDLRSLGLDRTVAFHTGANSGGYVLNRVEAAVSRTEVSAFAANARVSIYSDGSSAPGTELFTLKTPADAWGPRTSFDDYEESFWVPSGTAANLTASTWYWVVFSMQPNKDTGAYYLDGVTNASADAKPGWQIHSDARTRSRTITNDPWTFFQSDSDNWSIQIGIYASPNTGTDHKNPVPLDTAPTGGI